MSYVYKRDLLRFILPETFASLALYIFFSSFFPPIVFYSPHLPLFLSACLSVCLYLSVYLFCCLSVCLYTPPPPPPPPPPSSSLSLSVPPESFFFFFSVLLLVFSPLWPACLPVCLSVCLSLSLSLSLSAPPPPFLF